jgi:hypothetical protein
VSQIGTKVIVSSGACPKNVGFPSVAKYHDADDRRRNMVSPISIISVVATTPQKHRR